MTGIPSVPNYHGRRLLREIKKLREQARLTQEEAGERAHISVQKLSRMETQQLPTFHELYMLLDVYGVLSADWQPYLDLWELAKQPGWWRPYRLKETRYIRMEDEADAKYEFQLGYLPTLLQTKDYARTALTNTARFDSTQTIDNHVEAQRLQQQRLLCDNPLRLRALLHEPTLHQGVDRTQLTQLVTHAELPNVTLQVVPQNTLHDGLHGSVVLLSFNDPHETDIAFTEDLLGLSQSQNAEQATAVRRTLDRLAGLAMSPCDSVNLIKGLISRT